MASLISEGYVFQADAFLLGNIYSVTLRHASNGNRIVVTRRGRVIEIKKNQQLIKSYKI